MSENSAVARRCHAWTTTDDRGEPVHHYKTVDEHGVTIGEHIEGGYYGINRWYRVLSGRPITRPSVVEEVFGIPSLVDVCQEGRERRAIS